MSSEQSVRPTGREPRRRPRNMHVEMLRVVAILGIAVFHTLQPWFWQVAVAAPLDALPEAMRPVASNAPAMWVLGVTALLGAFGNHVFYMISGFYLIPSAARKSLDAGHSGCDGSGGHGGHGGHGGRGGHGGYWRAQLAATARKAAVIVLSVLFYIAVCAVINRFVPVEGFGAVAWWGMGLEFVWLYLVFVVIAPVAAWLFARMDARVLRALVAAALVAVFALNAYIAFVAPEGGRGLTDWRKLMSAVTYLVSFLFAGVCGMGPSASRTARASRSARAADMSRTPRLLPASFWRRALTVLAVAVMAAEAVLVAIDARGLLTAVSFKSTSLVSFLAAWFALMATARAGAGAAADVPTSDETDRPSPATRPAARPVARMSTRFTTTVAAGILGFYIAQSLLGGLWHNACTAFMTSLAASGGMGIAAGLAFGVAFSAVFVLAVTVIDHLTRQPLLRAMRLLR